MTVDFALISAPVTAFAADGTLNIDATRRLFEYLRQAGVTGIIAAGTTGEFVALSDDERIEVIAAAIDVFNGGGGICPRWRGNRSTGDSPC